MAQEKERAIREIHLHHPQRGKVVLEYPRQVENFGPLKAPNGQYTDILFLDEKCEDGVDFRHFNVPFSAVLEPEPLVEGATSMPPAGH
jgi:hypothetical protein